MRGDTGRERGRNYGETMVREGKKGSIQRVGLRGGGVRLNPPPICPEKGWGGVRLGKMQEGDYNDDG